MANDATTTADTKNRTERAQEAISTALATAIASGLVSEAGTAFHGVSRGNGGDSHHAAKAGRMGGGWFTTTGDPQFRPDAPVTINGYRFVPA